MHTHCNLIMTYSSPTMKVFIANTLEYSIGYIQFINNDIVDNGFTLDTRIVATIAVITVMIILAIVSIVIITTCICIRRKYSR